MSFAWTRFNLSMFWNLNIWGCVLDELGTDETKCCSKVVNGRRVAGLWLMLGFCSLSVLESCMYHCLYLFLCRALRQ